MTVSYVARHSVLLSFAHHLKPNDLNSISCLLSMRLCRHAYNRKFALTGIDQQPLIVTHDSEVSHDSSACKTSLYFIIGQSRNTGSSLGLLFHDVSHGSSGDKLEVKFSLQPWIMVTVTIYGKKVDLPALSHVLVFDPLACAFILSGKSLISRVTQRW